MIPGIRARLGTSLRTPRRCETQPPSHPLPCTLMTDSQSESDTHTLLHHGDMKIHDLSSAFKEHCSDTEDVFTLKYSNVIHSYLSCHNGKLENCE